MYLGAPEINHLLFADDNLFFCKADKSSSLKLLEIFKRYELALGQYINTTKATMIFSKNFLKSLKEEIMAIWGSNQSQQYEKYLGLPFSIGKARKRAFFEIKAKLWQQLNLWKGKLLSEG